MNKDNKIAMSGSYFKTNKIGKWKLFYYDQNVYIEQDFKDNIGDVENYYDLKTGQPFTGKFVVNFDNGKIKNEFKISNGLRDGKSKYYDENEKLIKTENYDNGLLKK